MKTTIATIQGAEIILFREETTGAELVQFTADMDVDCDGSGGNPEKDPCFQPDTRLRFMGRPLHAELIPYVVVPPVVLAKTNGRVLGCLCECRNMRNGRTARAVVGDSGPAAKVGEGSPALCRLLGLDDNPNRGGTQEFIIEYTIHVNTPAVVPVTFNLQAA